MLNNRNKILNKKRENVKKKINKKERNQIKIDE